jgi:hypothetical protein
MSIFGIENLRHEFRFGAGDEPDLWEKLLIFSLHKFIVDT